MRRLGIAAVLLSGIVTGCVSDDLGPAEPQPYQFYRPRPHAQVPPPTSAHAQRVYPRGPAPYRAPVDAPSPWFPAGGRISPRWTYIVVHHSATRTGGAAAFDKYHREQNGWDELGYHFVIGNGTNTPDGQVEVGSRWRTQKHGAHCKTPDNYFNEHGIGICLVGDFTRTSPTPKQYASLMRLVRFLSARCRIDPSHITTHGALTHKTQCPGRRFQLAGVRAAVAGRATASVMP